MVNHEGSSIPNYFRLSLPFVNTNELGLQDLSLGSQWLQSGFVPMKSEEIMLAAVEKGISKGTCHTHSLTFHESQKRRWGTYLLEAWRLLQEVHQSVRQKTVGKKIILKNGVPRPRIPTKPWRCQHSYPAALGGPTVCWDGEGKTAAGFSGKVRIWNTARRQGKTQEHTQSFNYFMGIIIHKGNKINSA